MCSFSAHVALWLEVKMFFGNAEQEYLGNGTGPMSGGTLEVFCNCTPYCWITTLLKSVSRDHDECLKVSGPCWKPAGNSGRPLLMWLCDNGFAPELSAGKYSCCLLFLCNSNKEERRGK